MHACLRGERGRVSRLRLGLPYHLGDVGGLRCFPMTLSTYTAERLLTRCGALAALGWPTCREKFLFCTLDQYDRLLRPGYHPCGVKSRLWFSFGLMVTMHACGVGYPLWLTMPVVYIFLVTTPAVWEFLLATTPCSGVGLNHGGHVYSHQSTY